MRRGGTTSRFVALGLVLATAWGATACSGGESAAPPGTTAPTATVPGTSTTEAPLDEGKQIFVYTPSVGDCFDRRKVGPAGAQSDVVLLLDCDLPHERQVFAVLEYPVDPVALADPNTRTWPGDQAVRAWSQRECADEFAGYVGIDFELSRLEYTFEAPTESTWLSSRTVTCLLEEPGDRRLSGSKRDARE